MQQAQVGSSVSRHSACNVGSLNTGSTVWRLRSDHLPVWFLSVVLCATLLAAADTQAACRLPSPAC